MAGGVGDYFKLDDCDKEEFEALEVSRSIWYSFGKSIELMTLDVLNLKKKNLDPSLCDIERDIHNLEKHIHQDYSYLHCLKMYIEIADKLILAHVKGC
jgi:hypothetical protein